MTQYELIYFNITGRAHHIRYLFHDQGIEYKETFVSSKEWPNLKGQMPFGQLPCLMEGSFQLVQSNAILRHLARKYGLYGDGVKEAAMIDMFNDGIEDAKTKFVKMIYTNFDESKGPYIKDDVPKMFERFERLLSANDGGNGFAVGNKISFVDYSLFHFIDLHYLLSPACVDAFPALKAYYQRMLNRPRIKAFRETDLHRNMMNTLNGKF